MHIVSVVKVACLPPPPPPPFSRPWPEAVNIIITGILIIHRLSLDRMPGLKQNACYIKTSMSGLLSAVVVFVAWQTPIVEVSKAPEQSPELQIILHLYVWQCMYSCGETVAYATFSPDIRWTSGLFSWGMLPPPPPHPPKKKEIRRSKTCL